MPAKLPPPTGSAQMEEKRKAPTELHEILRDSVQRHDAKAIATVLHVPVNTVYDMFTGDRRNPFEQAVLATEAMIANGNPAALDTFLAAGRRLGLVLYQQEANSIDDVAFADVMGKFTEVLRAKGEAERDGVITPNERMDIAKQAREAAAQLLAYADRQVERAIDEQRQFGVRKIR